MSQMRVGNEGAPVGARQAILLCLHCEAADCAYLVLCMPPRGRRRRKPTDKGLFVFAFFLAPQIHLKGERWTQGLGLRFLMRPAGGASPFRTESLCVAREAGVVAVALGDRRMSQPPRLPGTARPSLPPRPTAPCPRAAAAPGSPSGVSLPPCTNPSLPESPLRLWAAGPALGVASFLHTWRPSLPKFQGFSAQGGNGCARSGWQAGHWRETCH